MPRRPRSFVLPALAFALMAGIFSPAPAMAQASAPFIQIPAETAYRTVLERHGQFYAHETYGVVWVPTSMPQGWRPYSDCRWVQHKDYGWFYDDKTEWGRIVHHYGRWAHDERVGWMWIPGAEWSPGWVVWRAGDTHVGWAPMPPDADVVKISVEQFNSDKHWQFRETADFKSGCASQSPAPTVDVALLRGTRVVTQTRFVNGVFIYEVPVVGEVVAFDVGVVLPWSPGFIGTVFGQWNRLWNDVTGDAALLNAALNQCTIDRPDRKLNLPFAPRPPAPPAPPFQRRADAPPPGPVAPPVVSPPFVPPVVTLPPSVIVTPQPPVFTIPPVVVLPPRDPRPPFHPPRHPPHGDTKPFPPVKDPVRPPVHPPVKPPREALPTTPPKFTPPKHTPPVLTRPGPRFTPPLRSATPGTVLRHKPSFTPKAHFAPKPSFAAPRFAAPRPSFAAPKASFAAPRFAAPRAFSPSPMRMMSPRGFGGRGRLF